MESFDGKLRDELLDREVFYTLREAQILTEQYRRTCNHIRLYSSFWATDRRRPKPYGLLNPPRTL